jgi:GDP-mannose 6-dehydrogenase
MRVAVFGVGHVGAVTAACLARDGHEVLAVDPDEARLSALAAGRAPVVEPHLDDLVAELVAAGRLRPEPDPAVAVAASEIALLCVGTAGGGGGRLDLADIETAAAGIGRALRGRSQALTVAVRSTVPPGTTERVILPLLEAASDLRLGDGLEVAALPEFAREGNAIHDNDDPPYLLIGALAPGAVAPLQALFRRPGVPCAVTDAATAEMVKLASNAWHALKVAFANEIGAACTALDIDGQAVMEMLCDDTKLNLSPAYLQPGFAFGGPCLGKDVRALAREASAGGVELPLLSAVLPANEAHIARALAAILALGRRRIGLLGLSFKPRVADLRDSPLVALAERLLAAGCELSIYDADLPACNPELAGVDGAVPPMLAPHLAGSLTQVMKGSDVVVVGKPDRRYAGALAALRPGQGLLDLADPRAAVREPPAARLREAGG